MTRARARRRSIQYARHMNRVTSLGAHSVSWGCVRAMNHPAGWDSYYFVRAQGKS